MKKKLAALLAGVLLAGVANAAVVTDPVVQSIEAVLNGNVNRDVSYRHTLSPNSLATGAPTAGTLSVELERTRYLNTPTCSADVNCNVTSGWYPVDLFVSGETDRIGTASWSETVLSLDVPLPDDSLTFLNDNGYLEVSLRAMTTSGEARYTVGDSLLTLIVPDTAQPTPPMPGTGTPPAAVAEPATISLLGLGLLAAGALRRRAV